MATMYGITNGNSKRPQTVSVSGGVGTYTGDWCIETQSLSIRYIRIPTAVPLVSMTPLSLSSTNIRQNAVAATRLICMFFPSYSMRKEVGTTYTTSADTQLQKFSVAGMDADKFGTTYGTVSGNILGPAGYIYTSQPYIRRVAWDDSIHSEVSLQRAGSNIIVAGLSAKGQRTALINANSHVTFENARYNLGVGPSQAHNFCGATDVHYGWLPVGTTYQIYLDYATDKESNSQLAQFLDNVGDAIRTNRIFKQQPATNEVNGGTLLTAIVPTNDAYTGLSYYNKDRHDYT